MISVNLICNEDYEYLYDLFYFHDLRKRGGIFILYKSNILLDLKRNLLFLHDKYDFKIILLSENLSPCIYLISSNFMV